MLAIRTAVARAVGVVALALLAVLTAACGSPLAGLGSGPGAANPGGRPREVTVFAASSLADAFNELAAAFERETPGVKVVLNYGATSQLRTQIEQGARADVFAAASQAEMTRAVESTIVSGEPQVFARNRLAVIVPKDNPGRVATLRDLARPGVKIVATDKSVPIGQYTLDMLDKMAQDPAYGQAYRDAFAGNVVSHESNVRQVVAKVRLGEAGAAVVYQTDVTPDAAAALTVIAVPDAYNTLAAYPIAAVAGGAAPDLAAKFVAFAVSDAGQAILKRHGFIPPA